MGVLPAASAPEWPDIPINDDMASFLSWCVDTNQQLHYKALVDGLAANTFAKVTSR